MSATYHPLRVGKDLVNRCHLKGETLFFKVTSRLAHAPHSISFLEIP